MGLHEIAPIQVGEYLHLELLRVGLTPRDFDGDGEVSLGLAGHGLVDQQFHRAIVSPTAVDLEVSHPWIVGHAAPPLQAPEPVPF